MASAGGRLLDDNGASLLGDGEELLGRIDVRKKSRVPGLSGFYSGLIEIEPEPEPLPNAMKMAVAITSRRVLVLEMGGARSSPEVPKRVVIEMPLAEVGSVELDKSVDMWRVHWDSDGVHYTVALTAGKAGPFFQTLKAAAA